MIAFIFFRCTFLYSNFETKLLFVLSNSKNICFRLGILLYSFFGLILELDRIENEFSDINVPLTTDVLDRLSLCVNSIGEDLYLLNLQR